MDLLDLRRRFLFMTDETRQGAQNRSMGFRFLSGMATPALRTARQLMLFPQRQGFLPP